MHITSRNQNLRLHPILGARSIQPTVYEILISSGNQNPAYAYSYPHPSLPSCFFLPDKDEYVSIPKGKIIAGIGQKIGESSVPILTADGLIVPDPVSLAGTESTAGDIYNEQINMSQSVLHDDVASVSMDDSSTPIMDAASTNRYGFDEYFHILWTIANGGYNIAYDYSEADTGAVINPTTGNFVGTYNPMSPETVTNGANRPFGWNLNNTRRYMNGRSLNYYTSDIKGIQISGQINVPYINLDITWEDFGLEGAPATFAPLIATGSCVNTNPMYRLSKIWAFSYDPTSGHTRHPSPGMHMFPDRHGNYVTALINTSNSAETNSLALIEQCVGTATSVDFRMPKNKYSAMVQGYPYSGTPSTTETGGIPGHLVHFIRDFCILCNVPRTHLTPENLYKWVHDKGYFGLQYINTNLK